LGTIRELGPRAGGPTGGGGGRLEAVSGELDGRERGRGSPATASGVGRAREREKLHKTR
jgi:hypothetical protein